MLKKIAIIGRPNVGKSTLFNRLAGKKIALVDDRPGVTRDWKETPAQLGDLRFSIIDTAGLEGFESEDVFQQILKQTERVITQADIILFMIDGLQGVIPSDQRLAEKLRRTKKPVVLLVNKAENAQKAFGVSESHKLGLGEPLAISAAHGEGLYELYQALEPYIADKEIEEEIDEEISDTETEQEAPPLSLVVVGRPNAGKSTLINRLLGEERLIASDQPGITRDTVSIDWSWQGKPIRLVDTAGIRRRARVEDQLEKASVSDALRAVRFAQVVILMVDARSPLDHQDLVIASKVIEEGRCLVIGLNKWDIADPKILKDVQHTLETSLSQVKGLPLIPISAKHGRNLDKLLQAVLDVYSQWNRRLSTGKLNQWLEAALERHPAPLSGANRVRLKYMTQIKSRPPTFVIFVSKPTELPESYIRYLTTSLRQQFDMFGVPIRLYLRKGKNPYADDQQ